MHGIRSILFVLGMAVLVVGMPVAGWAVEGGLDPSACVKVGVVEGAVAEPRPGVNVSEINLLNLSLPSTLARDLSFSSDGGTLFNGTRWIDFNQLFSHLGIVDEPSKAVLREWFDVGHEADPEAMWLDDGDGIKESDEWYHRFNMARTDWDTPLTVAQILDDVSANPPAAWTTVASHNGTCIPWLKNYANLPPATFASAVDRAKQIAANLVDYCDSDDEPTADQAPGTWSNAIVPLYTGNEKTPYINEITAEIEAMVLVAGSSPFFTYDYFVNVDIGCEVVNIYGTNLAGSTLILYGDLKYRVHGESHTININAAVINIGSVNAHSYRYGLSTIPVDLFVMDVDDLSQDFMVESLDIRKAILMVGGNKVDYASLPDNSGTKPLTNVALLTPGVNGPISVSCSWQANDPRQNLNVGDWTYREGMLNEALAPPTATPNAENVGVTYAVDGDAEAVFTVATISTGYIRNAPMQSPWELGFIHRGAKWETINLKKYNSTSGVKSADGICDYAAGDANILDQIKMTGDTETYSKVNINNPSMPVLRALFQDIYVGTGPGNPGAQVGTVIDAARASWIATDVFVATMIEGGFSSRGQLAGVVALSDDSLGMSQSTDATREGIIGKVINLLKASEITDDLYRVEFMTDGTEGATLTGDLVQTVSYGCNATQVFANAPVGYDFLGWSGAYNGTENPLTLTSVIADMTVTAQYEVATYDLSYDSSGHGTVNGGAAFTQTVSHGSDGTLVTATPDAGYHFVGWSDSATDNPRQDTSVTADIAVTANFAINEYRVEFMTDGTPDTAITGSLVQTVTHGADCTPVAAMPPLGGEFLAWSGGYAGTENPLTVTNVTSDLTITANFQMEQVACGATFVMVAEDVSLTVFKVKPKVYATYNLNGKASKASAKVLTHIGKVDWPVTIACEWTKKHRLYDLKAFKASEHGGIGAAGWITVTTMHDLVMDLRLSSKEATDQSVQPLALAVPVIANITDGGKDAKGNDTLVITGQWFGTKKPKVWREYWVPGKVEGTFIVKRQAMKVVKPALDNTDYLDSKLKPACMDPETGASKVIVIVPVKQPKGVINGTIVLENGVGMAVGGVPAGDAP